MIPLLLVTNDNKKLKDFLSSISNKDDVFFEIIPEKTEYSINEIKNIVSETKIFYSQRRLYYLPNFHISSLPAQNAFLKMLEEPPSNVQIILTTDRAEKLLPTIVSRCKIINLAHKVLKEDGEVESLLLNFILDKEKGIFNQKPFNKIDKENVDKLIEQIILFFRKRLSIDSKAANVIKEIIRLKTLVTNNNLNPQLTIDHILIYIMKRYTIN